MPIENARIREHAFLANMARDPYFPPALVDKGKEIFARLCERIELQRPTETASVLALTHAATEEWNQLGEEFLKHDSEIETAAREAIAADFAFVLAIYGYDIDIEDAIAPREW